MKLWSPERAQGPRMPYQFRELATYRAECARGIVHTAEWDARMAGLQRDYDEWSARVAMRRL